MLDALEATLLQTSTEERVKNAHPGKKVVGYGWCGVYDCKSEYRLGWLMSPFISHHYREPLSHEQLMASGCATDRSKRYAEADMFRVKITIEPVFDKNGNPVVKRWKKWKRSKPNAAKEKE